jgi:glutamate-5-semialdehyde dehydrogenase
MSQTVREIAERSKRASRALSNANTKSRNDVLRTIAQLLEANVANILRVNREDIAEASQLVEKGEMSSATADRLRLSERKICEMASSVRAVANLPDPIGRILERTELDTNLVLDRVSCPLGVLAVIFEARPDAVTQISALALKSGNAVVLKPGKEVERTASLLVETIRYGLRECLLPEDAVNLAIGREAVHALLGMRDLVDLVIPRGSKQLVESVQLATHIPVLGHAEGICHIYVDAAADLAMALAIIDDAKTDYPAACNAVETVLVNEAIAASFLPGLAERMQLRGVRLRGCERVRTMLPTHKVEAVPDGEWHKEYGDLVLAVRVVSNLGDAIDHIHHFGSGHTETIVTADRATAERFLREVDAAGVYHNASTRFADGYRYGLGAEVGVSTSKLHARGPVGLAGLTTYKYVLRGQGQIVSAYRGDNAREFRHVRLPV